MRNVPYAAWDTALFPAGATDTKAPERHLFTDVPFDEGRYRRTIADRHRGSGRIDTPTLVRAAAWEAHGDRADAIAIMSAAAWALDLVQFCAPAVLFSSTPLRWPEDLPPWDAAEHPIGAIVGGYVWQNPLFLDRGTSFRVLLYLSGLPIEIRQPVRLRFTLYMQEAR